LSHTGGMYIFTQHAVFSRRIPDKHIQTAKKLVPCGTPVFLFFCLYGYRREIHADLFYSSSRNACRSVFFFIAKCLQICFILHRAIPVISVVGYARKKENLLHRGYNPAMKNKTPQQTQGLPGAHGSGRRSAPHGTYSLSVLAPLTPPRGSQRKHRAGFRPFPLPGGSGSRNRRKCGRSLCASR